MHTGRNLLFKFSEAHTVENSITIFRRSYGKIKIHFKYSKTHCNRKCSSVVLVKCCAAFLSLCGHRDVWQRLASSSGLTRLPVPPRPSPLPPPPKPLRRVTRDPRAGEASGPPDPAGDSARLDVRVL